VTGTVPAVSVDTSPSRHDTPEPDAPGPRLSRRAKVGVAVVLLSLTAMWSIIAIGHFTKDNPDTLSDGATTARAEQVCEQVRAGLPVVPKGRNAETPAVRADRLDAETAAFGAMVDQLATLRWSTPHDQALVDTWLADWRQHLADRTVYAESVRANGRNDIVFNGAAPDGESVTFRMDAFADTNGLSACFTLDDPAITET
jgi:hypothetical protein